jgi:hypothetical protein
MTDGFSHRTRTIRGHLGPGDGCTRRRTARGQVGKRHIPPLTSFSPADGPEEDEDFVLPILDRMKAAITPRLNDSRVPERIIEQFADILRKASTLYHYDTRPNGGTTAPAVPESLEQMRYRALDLLIGCASWSERDGARVAGLVVPSLVTRFETALRQFVDDAKLRGRMPFPRSAQSFRVCRYLTVSSGYEKRSSCTCFGTWLRCRSGKGLCRSERKVRMAVRCRQH